jgi:hypothetical protein
MPDDFDIDAQHRQAPGASWRFLARPFRPLFQIVNEEFAPDPVRFPVRRGFDTSFVLAVTLSDLLV